MKSNFFLVEINTQRQQFKSCLLCFKDFSVMTKEHQCKRCKRAVCDKCAQNKMIILGYSKSKDPHRVCNVCKAESDMLKQFVRTNQIQFNRDSIGIEWLQNMAVDLRSLKDIYRVHEQKDQMEYNQFINQVDSIYDEIEKKMNYSIKEYFSLINLEKKAALISLKHLLGTFLKNNPEVGFHPSLIFLALIFLSIGSEPTAYYFIEQLYTKIIPKQVHFRNLRLGYEFKSELTLILNSFHNLKIPSEPIKPFLQEIAPYIVSLTVNAFEIQSTLFILSQLFQEDGYHEFIKVLACALSTHQFKDGLQHKVFLMWNVKEQNFQKYYYDMKKLRCNSSSIRSVSLSDQQQQLEEQFKKEINQLKQENTQLKQEQTIDRMKIVQQKIDIDKYNEQIIDLEDELKNFKLTFSKIEQENQNLLEQNQNLKLQLMKQGNDSSSITQSTKSDTTHIENELLKCKQEIEVLKLQNTNPNQMTQLVKIKNQQIAKLSQEKAELEKRIEDLEEPKISKRTSSVAQINSVIKDLEDGKNLLEKKNQEILQLKKQLSDLQQQNQKNQSMTSSQQLQETNPSRKLENFEDTSNKDLQLLIQDIDPAKKAAARNLKSLINKLQEEIIYYKTQAELKKEQVEPFRQKSESLQKQLDFLVEQNKELQIEIEHKQDLIQELEKKKMKASIEPRPQVVDDRKVLNENKSSCAANSDCIIF